MQDLRKNKNILWKFKTSFESESESEVAQLCPTLQTCGL